MTFEEIQKTIEGMLAVQRELQEGQLKIQESQIQDRERIDRISTTLERMLAVQRELQESQIQGREQIEPMLTVLERMLATQRELQESQIQLRDMQQRERETIQILVEEMNRLIEISNRHERRIDQLIGYSISGESDRLNLLQRIMTLESKVQKLENGQDN